MSLMIRLAVKEDEPFLRKLAYDHFYEILFAWAWPEATREHLLQLQIDGQNSSYRAQFPNAPNGIIMLDDRAIGRILLDRGADGHTLVDILIVKEKRNRGVGTWLLRALCTEADLLNKHMRLQVQVSNPAQRLYQRMGFHKIGGDEMTMAMERLPNTGERIVTGSSTSPTYPRLE
jgi:GNAT superfamily N-acetyltransferase